jgi:hypothetical protein
MVEASLGVRLQPSRSPIECACSDLLHDPRAIPAMMPQFERKFEARPRLRSVS